MKLRRLTESGIAQFAGYLTALRDDPKLRLPESLLVDTIASEPLPTETEVEKREFASRFEAAEYLYGVLSSSGLADLDRDSGLWAWLAVFYFDQLCPTNGRGDKSVGESARYIPATGNYLKFYRHLLLAPFNIYRLHRDQPSVLIGVLMNPVDKPGDLYEQIASRQERISNRLLLTVINRLYVDVENNRLKRGTTSQNQAGSLRRLLTVLTHFELTFDLFTISTDQIMQFLPREFNRFKQSVGDAVNETQEGLALDR